IFGTRWYGDYVLFHLVEHAGEKVMDSQRDKMSLGKEFTACVGNPDEISMSDLDMKEREQGVVVVDTGIIKFLQDSEAETDAEITTVDRGILELKTAVANLRSQIEGIQMKSENCKQKASSALAQNQKPMALSYLRSKKLLDELLSKRLGALANLEGTLIQVEGAAGDIEILASYKSSTSTLRSILSHPSLQRGSIEKTMEAMAEANEDAKEIDEAVRFGGDVALGISSGSDDELEEELKRLVDESEQEKKEEMEKEVRSKLGGIPELPTSGAQTERRPDSEREAVGAL
ncbi:hypothetical protein BT96DRAFT_919926, partial [Gymnopus androsaceus JB14]